jgi:CspA family cold shock protein
MHEYEGVVKWYDPNKAFGFLTGGPEGDVFVHKRNIDPSREELIEGQQVLFKVRSGMKGQEAFDVHVTRESDLPPRPRLPRDPMSTGGRGGFSRSGGGFDNRFRGDSSDSSSSNFGRGPRREVRPQPQYTSLPKGPVTCTVVSRDRDDRFMFVRSERDDFEIFVHGSLFRDFGNDVRRGDRVRVTIEQSAKGLRATSLELT